MINATIYYDDPKLITVLENEIKQERSWFETSLEKDRLIFTVTAKDIVSFRSTMNTIITSIMIFEKVKNVRE